MFQTFLHRGGLWVAVQSALMTIVIAAGFLWQGKHGGPAFTIVGVFLLVLAACCGVAGTLALGRNLTPFPHPNSQANFVRHGIYGWVRHPLYAGLITAAVGWAFLRRSWPSFIAAVALAVFLDIKARREERALRHHFPEYDRYQGEVKKFLPWIY